MSRMLSPNSSLGEFIFSQPAVWSGIDNMPDAATLRNLKHLGEQLEIVRDALGEASIPVNSGYRSAALKRAVKGWVSSAHGTGSAVAFTTPRFGTVLQTANAVAASGIAYDQVIYEFGRWGHLGVTAPGAVTRRELWSFMVAGRYIDGLRNVT